MHNRPPPQHHKGKFTPIGSRSSWFSRFAKRAAHLTGQPLAFFIACGAIVLWSLTGPLFHFDDTWQLLINTTTTIVTFLMVFIIQNAQNRDSVALQLKLDELLRAQKHAHNSIIDLEELEDIELQEIRARYTQLAKRARAHMRKREDPFEVFADVGVDVKSENAGNR